MPVSFIVAGSIVNTPVALPVHDVNIGIELAGIVTVKVPVLPLMIPAIVICADPVMPEKPIVPVIAFPFWFIVHDIVPSEPMPMLPLVGIPITDPVDELIESPAVPTHVPAAAVPVLPDPDDVDALDIIGVGEVSDDELFTQAAAAMAIKTVNATSDLRIGDSLISSTSRVIVRPGFKKSKFGVVQ